MALTQAEISILVTAKNLASAVLKDVEKDANRLSGVMGGVAKVAGGFLVANVLQTGASAFSGQVGSMISGASDLTESLSKVRVVFGENAAGIEQWAAKASTSMGQSKQQALEAAGTFGNLFDAIGLSGPQAADMSKSVVGLATDLSSFNNVPTDVALEKLRAGLVGEVEPLRTMGVNINAAMAEAKAMELGLADANGEISEGAKVQARYALIVEQTTNAQGDFARTSDGLANKQRIASAQWADMKAKIGTGAMPAMIGLTTFVSTMLIPAIGKLTPAIAGATKAIQFIADHFDIIGPILAGVATTILVALVPAIVAWTAAEYAKATALLASAAAFAVANAPLILIAIAIGLLVVGIILLIKHWDQVTAAVMKSIHWLEEHKAVMAAVAVAIVILLGPIGLLIVAAVLIWRNWEKLRDVAVEVWRAIEDEVRGVVDRLVPIIEIGFEIIRNTVETAINAVRDIIKIVTALIHGDWSAAWEAFKDLLSGIWSGIVSDVGLKLEFLKAVLSLYWDGYKYLAGLAWDGIKALVSLAMQGMINAVIFIGEGILNWFRALPWLIVTAVGALATLLLQLGRDLIQGLWDGMDEVWGDLKGWIEGIPGTVKDILTGGFLTNSPSRMTAAIGYDVMDGLRVGMENGSGGVFAGLQGILARVREIAGEISGAVASAAAGAAAGAPAVRRTQESSGGFTPQQMAYINAVARQRGESEPYPGYARGVAYVPRTGLAMLHEGEAVIPRQLNAGNAQQYGITGNNIYITLPNVREAQDFGREFDRYFRR